MKKEGSNAADDYYLQNEIRIFDSKVYSDTFMYLGLVDMYD